MPYEKSVLPARLATPLKDREPIGVTTSSFMRLLASTDGLHRITLEDVPAIMSDELGLKVIDINTTTLGACHHLKHITAFREVAERHGCQITNLKVNERDLPFADPDSNVRERALREYMHWIDGAAALGARWLRPYLPRTRPDWNLLLDGYRRMIDYATPRGITLLVENFLWIELESDVDAIPRLIADLGGRIHASPDTGNWADGSKRLEGLRKAFAHAVTCDFKAKNFEPDYTHPDYDLKACYTIGRQQGFRGPWCIEHLGFNRAVLFDNLRHIRDLLRGWIHEGDAQSDLVP